MIVVSICLSSDALSQCLPSYWGFSYLDVEYLLTAAAPDLGCRVSPLDCSPLQCQAANTEYHSVTYKRYPFYTHYFVSTSLKLLIYPSITPEDEPPRLEGVKYVIKEEQLAITNSFRKNEALGQSRNNAQLRMSSSESKVQSCSSVQSLGHV